MHKAAAATQEALKFYLETEAEPIKVASALIVQGQPGAYLDQIKADKITALTYDAAHHQEWSSRRISSVQSTEETYDLIIHFGGKSESETRLALGKYAQRLNEGGRFIAAVHNRLGSSRYRKQIAELFPEVESSSKSKSRVFEAYQSEGFNNALAQQWTKLEAPTKIADSDFETVPGIYAENKIDVGSELLGKYIRDEYWGGRGADLGSGYGYLSRQVLSTRHKVKEIHLYELDYRALEMAKQNLSDFDGVHTHWCDVAKEVPRERPYHWVIMNPPFHEGTDQDFDLGKAFIQQAAAILAPGSPLFMVANLHLPYEETLYENFRSVVKLGEEKGFKLFRAIR